MLRIEDLRARGDNGLEVLHGVNLAVREGAIVGIAGVSGNGQRELVEVIAGQRSATSGRITVNGENHLPSRAMLREHQFFTLPEEPLRNAAVAGMSVTEKMVFGVFDQSPVQRSGFLLDRGAIERFGRELIDRFSVRPPSPDVPIGELSGGNVQRAILARELWIGRVRILVAANQCFGLDFKAVDFIHDLLVETRNTGAAVLLISEDLDELLLLADRIFVMTEGIVAMKRFRARWILPSSAARGRGSIESEQRLPHTLQQAKYAASRFLRHVWSGFLLKNSPSFEEARGIASWGW